MLLNRKPNNHCRQGFTLVEVMVSFFIFGLIVSGLVYGYVQVNRMSEFSSMSLAAQWFATQGLEEAKSVQFPSVRLTNGVAGADDPHWTVSGYTNLPAQVNTLDVPTTGALILVTNYVKVMNVMTNLGLNLRQIRSDAVWQFPLDNIVYTNTAITIRAPDQ
jgi:prepilin-type N-terminal cleavage/methylation domain-containing protein